MQENKTDYTASTIQSFMHSNAEKGEYLYGKDLKGSGEVRGEWDEEKGVAMYMMNCEVLCSNLDIRIWWKQSAMLWLMLARLVRYKKRKDWMQKWGNEKNSLIWLDEEEKEQSESHLDSN